MMHDDNDDDEDNYQLLIIGRGWAKYDLLTTDKSRYFAQPRPIIALSFAYHSITELFIFQFNIYS